MERSDKIGVSVAAAGHALLIAALSLGLLNAPAVKPPPPDSMSVSIVDEIALRSATRAPAPPSAAQAPEEGPTEDAAPAALPEPAPPVEKAITPPQPAPKPVPVPPKAEPKPKPVVKPEPKAAPKPEPKTKPLPPRPAPAKPAPAPVASKPAPKPASPSTATAPAKTKPAAKPAGQAGTGTGHSARASRLGPNFLSGIESDTAPAKATPTANAPLGADEARALNQEISRQLKPFWRAPTGADVDRLVTTLRWQLNPDGTLKSGPELVTQTGATPSNGPQQQLHVEAAIRAVRAAAPFRLPPDYYPYWKAVKFSFDRKL